jgi:hypothetical protein
MAMAVRLSWAPFNIWLDADTSIVLIKDNTWKDIRHAMENGRDIVVNLENGMRFRLHWEKTVYHNPIDGTEVTAQWESYGSTKKAPSNAHTDLEQMIFLVQPPSEHVDIDELVAYTKRMEAIVKESVPVRPIPLPGIEEKGRQIIIEIEMPKCEGWLKLSAFPSMEGLDASNLLRQVAATTQPQVISRLKFQMVFNIWGYQGNEARFS